jgi:hypothetical protein
LEIGCVCSVDWINIAAAHNVIEVLLFLIINEQNTYEILSFYFTEGRFYDLLLPLP